MGSSFFFHGKQSQLLLKLTEVELGLLVGVEFDKSGAIGSALRGQNGVFPKGIFKMFC